MENWLEGTRAGHTHEPNDVTVQLDGLGRQLSELDPGEPGRPESSDGPVFVDESGRRSKTYRRVGWVLAAICAVYAVTLVVAVLGGNSSAPWLPISGQDEKKPAEVEVQPAPADRTDSVVETPGVTPSASASGPASTNSLPPPGSVTGSAPARPDASASASATVAPPKGGGKATSSASAETSASASPGGVSPPPSAEPPPPVEEPAPTETTSPPANELEGAQ